MLPHYLVRKQAINDKLQGSVTTYLRCGGIVKNQIKKGLLLSLPVKFLKSMNIWQSHKQEGSCLVHFLPLAIKLLLSRRKCTFFARNNAKYLPILIFFHWRT